MWGMYAKDWSDSGEMDKGQTPEVIPMPLLLILPSHHEGRVDLFTPLPNRGEGLI